jgi:hypothetical protein
MPAGGNDESMNTSISMETGPFPLRICQAPCLRQSRHGPQNRLISYRPDPAELIGLANIKENKWRDLY